MAGRTAGATRNALSASERPVAPRGAVKTATDTSTASVGPLRAVQSALTERQFQRLVVDGLKQRGFLVFVFPEMRLTQAGWPDLTFVHPRAGGRVWFWELKRERGRVRPEQTALLAMLARVPGADARIVRPSDWDGLRDKIDREALEVPL